MSEFDPLVYVVVLAWNGKQDTLECLRSLRSVVYPNFKTLVVDNASSDGTAGAVQREFPDVELIVNQSNLRFAGGNNVGIRHALARHSDYVVLLNNDTVVEPNFLRRLVDAARFGTRVGMVGPKIYYYSDPKRIWYAGGRIELWKGWVSHVGVREIDAGQYDAPSETDYVTGCCVLVDRGAIERVGMLDESYFLYGEDADWSVRMRRGSYTLRYEPSAIVWHKLSVSSGGHLSWFKNWNKLKSQLRLMWRYAKPYHWLTIPFWLVINAMAGMYKARRRGT